MFSPRYVITNKILASLIEIEKASLVAELSELQPEWEVKIKSESLSKRAYSVMRFLGVSLDIDDIAKIVNDDPGRDDKPAQVALRVGVVAKEKDVQQVINWLNANKLVSQTVYLTKKFNQGNCGEKDLASLNSLVGERLVSPPLLGRYRDKNSVEYHEIRSPLPVEVKYQMEDLFLWFKSVGKSEIHPVLMASVMLFEIMRIRPFEEKNLMSALFFWGLIMASEGYGMKELWSYEEDFLKNKERLLEIAVLSVENGDLTGWLEFASKALAEAAIKSKIRLMNLVGDRPIFKAEGGKAISLSERQIMIMEEMTIRGDMTIKETREILPMISDDTILRDLKDLMTKKLIRKKGKTKGAVYVLGKAKSFK